MATVTKLSGPMTNRDAVPRVLNGSHVDGGYLRESAGVCSVTIGDQSPSTYHFCQVPSNARVSSIKLFWDGTGGTTTAIHLGVYSTTAQGGGVVDEDLFATAVALSSAVVGTDVVHEANVAGLSAVSGMEKRLWEVLGLSTDPGTDYDIKAKLSGTADNGGNLGILARYAI